MRCRQVRKRISPYVDSELGQRDMQAFVAHIGACRACRRELEETQSLHGMFASAVRFSAPSGLAARVMASVKEREREGAWHVFALRPLFFRIAEVTLAVVIVLIGSLSGSLLMRSGSAPVRVVNVRNSFHLEVFEPVPADSIGGIYVSMMGRNDEK